MSNEQSAWQRIENVQTPGPSPPSDSPRLRASAAGGGEGETTHNFGMNRVLTGLAVELLPGLKAGFNFLIFARP